MKFKLSLFVALALMLSGSLAVYSQGGLEGKANSAQAQTITMTCPKNLQIGPAYVPDGWQSLGNIERPLLTIKVDNQTQKVICEYGNANSLFSTYFIGQKIPTGYDCKIPSAAIHQAVCTKKTVRGRP